jgi:bacteriocin-like protein
MRQLTTKELQQTSGGLSSADIMGFLRGLFGSKDTPSKPWTPPVTPPSTGGGMGGVIGALAVGAVVAMAAAAAVLGSGLGKWLDSTSK